MKDKTTAALFALFLGWFGLHRFYLRQPGLGILYIFLFMTFGISFVLGIIDAIVLLAMDPGEFDRRYNEERVGGEGVDRYGRRSIRRDYRRQKSNQSYSSRPVRPTRRRTPKNVQIPERKRINPFKQSGIKKYKEFELEEAIEDFNKGLEISPKDVSLHFNLACAYSLTEQVSKAYFHLDKAVEYGFKDFDKLKTHDDLAYVRIQPQFEQFAENGFRLREKPKLEAPKENLLDNDVLLSQLKRLAELRDKGLITEDEFLLEKKKLIR
jgi:TM2 domain-containing membrane protein YozV